MKQDRQKGASSEKASPDPSVPEPDAALADAAATGSSRFAELHSRTFEMELLISGAVVFALLQIPPIVDRSFQTFFWTTGGTLRVLGSYGYVYVALVLFALISFFVIHLGLRAYWIGLVGLESVFPEGADWDNAPVGPVGRRLYRKKFPPLRQHIERMDDLCSLTFSFAFIVVLSALYSVVAVLVSGALGLMATWVLSVDVDARWVFFGMLAVLLAPQMVVTLVDRFFGKRFQPGGFLERWTDRLLRWSFYVSPIALVGQIQFTLQSRHRSERTTVLVFVTMMVLSFGLVFLMMYRAQAIRVDSLTRFPYDLDPWGVEPHDYRDQTPSVGSLFVPGPSIQSDVIRGPYVELFVPYYPERHNPLAERACPDLEPLTTSALRFRSKGPVSEELEQRVRDHRGCLASLFRVELDDRPLDDLEWMLTREEGNRLAGLKAYISVRQLSPGPHHLVVRQPREGAEPASGGPVPRQFVPDPSDRTDHIRFWR